MPPTAIRPQRRWLRSDLRILEFAEWSGEDACQLAGTALASPTPRELFDPWASVREHVAKCCGPRDNLLDIGKSSPAAAGRRHSADSVDRVRERVPCARRSRSNVPAA